MPWSSARRKNQIQALDRTQPGLPMKTGRGATMTHDYMRNGTTTLFAALDVLEGKVIGRCMQRHRHQEFIRFLNLIEREVPAGKAGPCDPRQLRHPQAPQSARLARTPSARHLPLHADLVFLGQCGRRLFAKLTRRRFKRGVFTLARRPTGRDQPLLAEPTANPNPLSGPPIPDASSPLSPAGIKR